VRLAAWGRADFAPIAEIVAFVLGLNAISADVRRGTIFSVLARPVSRGAVFFGIWTANVAVVAGLTIIRMVIMLAFFFSYGGHLDRPLVLGMAASFAGSALVLAVASALAAILPITYAILVFIGGLFVQGIAFGVAGGFGRLLALSLAAVTPLSVIRSSDVVQQLLTGQSQALADGTEILAYRVAWILLLIFIGAALFQRRDLAPRA
jgi:ABC-type transport system involved in multi-copper enzyme maturation permease subunit